MKSARTATTEAGTMWPIPAADHMDASASAEGAVPQQGRAEDVPLPIEHCARPLVCGMDDQGTPQDRAVDEEPKSVGREAYGVALEVPLVLPAVVGQAVDELGQPCQLWYQHEHGIEQAEGGDVI